ncbi:MAG: hypothetical protein A2136_04160 [Chloroflexi bacterium RBG_16_54_11]|nr:MAG: hypothetical protein A2136_04160 [Chloroflexi bacterium RBG_16_54_11]
MQVMKTCQAISQLGHAVYLYVPSQDQGTDHVDIITYYGLKTAVDIEWLPSRGSLHRYDFAYQAIRKARHMKADAAYVWLTQAGILSLMAGLPVIYEMHGPPEGRFGPVLFRLFQRLPGKKRWLPITHALAGQVRERFGIDPQLMRVSPNGVDLERYAGLPEAAVAREMLGLPPKLTAGYSGHLYPGRGMDLLLKLAKRFPAIHFLWVGGRAEDVNAWRERLAAEKIENVSLAGFVQNSQLPIYQAACDTLLMPYERVITGSSGGDSASYASPMKMFEYMASRRAIISSDLPVIREVLNPSNATLCPPEDVDAWTHSIGYLMADPERRGELAHQAWLDVQRYTWVERARNALEGFLI